MRIQTRQFIPFCAAVLMFAGVLFPLSAFGQTADELQAKIRERNDKIRAIEQEISQYQAQVEQASREASTLQGAVRTLDANGKKLASELSLTETNIEKTALTIDSLGAEMGSLEKDVADNTRAIAETLRDINEADSSSMIESLLLNEDISAVWEDIDTMESFQQSIKERIAKLREIQAFLLDKKGETERQKNELEGLKSELSDRKQLIEQNKKEKTTLLTETKNKESAYKTLVAQKTAEREAFERELFQFESQLQIVIDKTKVAPAGKGVLAWPLDSVKITQYFGRTVDAQRLYASGTHNGIDLGIPRNTPVKAARAGVITAVGNTDAKPGCYSYGKWVLIKHDNGLSTLYGHLDLIKVTQGQTVATGEVIGYSGMTGYATGPHLHFTVYATQGVRVQMLDTNGTTGCHGVTMPIADPSAYFDPMVYLP